MLSMADLKHKDGYPPVMMCTVVWTLAASVVAAILFAIFRGLPEIPGPHSSTIPLRERPPWAAFFSSLPSAVRCG